MSRSSHLIPGMVDPEYFHGFALDEQRRLVRQAEYRPNCRAGLGEVARTEVGGQLHNESAVVAHLVDPTRPQPIQLEVAAAFRRRQAQPSQERIRQEAGAFDLLQLAGGDQMLRRLTRRALPPPAR